MPLLDHFHPPLSEKRHWESFHAMWLAAMAARLNQQILPPNYFAEAQVHIGSRIEVDVAALEDEEAASVSESNGGVAVQTYAPPKITAAMPAVFPDEIELRIINDSAGPTVVAAVELISPGNKDRDDTRRAFAAKCASYLHSGIGLVIIDIVTERQSNLHDELIDLLRQDEQFRFPQACPLYAAAYWPRRTETEGEQIGMWLNTLAVGGELPTMPLALRGGPIVPLELELTYSQAKTRSRL